MADFSNILNETDRVIHENENGEITATSLRELMRYIINEINRAKADKVNPDEDEIIYGIPVITSCSYKNGTIDGNGATISKSDFEVSYSQSWTKNGEEQTPITSDGSITISLNQSSGFGNSVTILPNTSGSSRQINVYVKVTLNGKTSASQLVQVLLDVIHTDKLIYAEIPITDADFTDIYYGTKDISLYVTEQAISSNISDIQLGYILDDGNSGTREDEYELNTVKHGTFLSVFLLSNNNHTIVLINPITHKQEEITGAFELSYQNNNFQYNGESYKILAVPLNTFENISLIIQIKG